MASLSGHQTRQSYYSINRNTLAWPRPFLPFNCSVWIGMIISFCCATAVRVFLSAFHPLRVVCATYTPLFLLSTEGPYEAPRDADPSWQLEITVSGASAPLPLTNSQCCSVKWSVPQTRELHRCSPAPCRRHLWAFPQPSIAPVLLFTHVVFQHVNFHLMAPATFFCCQVYIFFPHHVSWWTRLIFSRVLKGHLFRNLGNLSIQIIFVYTASVTVKIVSRLLNSLTSPQTSKSGRKKILFKRKKPWAGPWSSCNL